MEALFRIEMLGRLSVRYGSREITRFRTQKTASLLACLALHRSAVQSRDMLIERFWPDSDFKAARTNLSVALNALRRQLEPPGVPAGAVLIADHTQVRLNPIAFTTDVEDFENALQAAERETDATKRFALWEQAIECYPGDLLPGFYEDWVLAERDRLRDASISALHNLVKACVEQRQGERAIGYAQRLVQADNLREESHQLLMRLLMAVGRPHDALQQYQMLERLLQSVLQDVPSPATRALAAQLSHLSPAPREAREIAPAESSPQATREEVRPAASRVFRPTLKVPLQFTRFFGREEEIRQIGAWMGVGRKPDAPAETASQARLITLTGPGGTGKTRLSVEIAGRVKEAFPNGLWFVPLAELDDPARLGEAIRDVLELPRQTHPPALDQVIAFLQEREQPVLLIMDNFEQIVAGGASVLWTLLNRVPLLWCLVTSRHSLALPGEREIPLAPLPIPTEEAPRETAMPPSNWEPRLLLTYPSVALFVDRAQAARPEFQITPGNGPAIAAICQKLEGIPLAIELAAARVKALTPAQILERLSKRFELLTSQRTGRVERHQSLWAAIDWSYHLLSPSVRRLFARLSVFHGEWTLEAAEAVCVEEMIQHLSPLDALTQLRGHSLLHAEENSETIRFRMLEIIRAFATEQLTSEEREEAERRHATYFQQWVRGAVLTGGERNAWFLRFEQEMDNLRAVLTWSLREGNAVELGLEMASAFRDFWCLRGHLSEGRQWLTRLLERAGATPTRALSEALHGAGMLAYMQGDFPAALPMLERCLALADTSENVEVVIRTKEVLGSIAYRQGEYAQARTHYEAALKLARTQEVHGRIASTLGNLANVAQATEDFATSHTLNLESLEAWRAAGDRNGEARTLNNLGNLVLSQGQLAEAHVYYTQSLVIKREIGDPYSLCATLRGIAEMAMRQEDYPTAASHLRESIVLARETEARSLLLEALAPLVELMQAIGEYAIAARVSGALERGREEMHYLLPPVDRPRYEQTQQNLEKALKTAGYQRAKREGSTLSLDQALTAIEETLAQHAL